MAPVLTTTDAVPFRFTPNIQDFIGPIMTDGIVTAGIVAIARSLTDPEVGSERLYETYRLLTKALYSMSSNNNCVS